MTFLYYSNEINICNIFEIKFPEKSKLSPVSRKTLDQFCWEYSKNQNIAEISIVLHRK